MTEIYGATRNLSQKYHKLIYEDNYKNDLNNESSILSKKFGNTLVNKIYIIIYLIYLIQ